MKLDRNVQAFDTYSAHLAQDVKKFKQRQADVDRRLLILTQSETSDDAVQKFELSMQSLQRLDVAKGYFLLLLEVENLR